MAEVPHELSLEVEVHEPGNARVDAVLRLVDEASRPRPLPEVLAALCSEVSGIMSADIVSLYLREGEALRMAANVGFPAGAVSRVRLRVGEGVTGHVAASLRPVSLRLASEDDHYKPFPELQEERFPIFLAVPLLVGHRAEAVLVLQRAELPFGADEVLLATTLVSSFAYALERAASRGASDAHADDAARATLSGAAVAGGVEIGRIETLPTFEGLAAVEREREGDPADGTAPHLVERRRERIAEALASLERDLTKVRKRIAPLLSEKDAQALETLALLEQDERFKEALFEEGPKQNLALGLRRVARDYAQAVFRQQKGGVSSPGGGWMAQRAEELEEFCLLVAARAVGARVPMSGAVLVLSERVGAWITLAAIANRASGIAIASAVPEDALSVGIAKVAPLPVVANVGGIFAWARAGDTAIVDGVEGSVRLNPSGAQIAKFRATSRA